MPARCEAYAEGGTWDLGHGILPAQVPKSSTVTSKLRGGEVFETALPNRLLFSGFSTAHTGQVLVCVLDFARVARLVGSKKFGWLERPTFSKDR